MANIKNCSCLQFLIIMDFLNEALTVNFPPLRQYTYSRETKVEIFVGTFEIVNVGLFGERIAVSLAVFETTQN